MATVKEHYDAHLGKVYAWMLGDFEACVQQQLQYFQHAQVVPAANGVAIDLGCGNGIQTMALANLGFKVIAVDFNRGLLDELRVHAGNKPVTIVEASISDVQQYGQPAELIICMGDTLPHLDSVDQVEQLLQQWFELLLPGGRLIASFRELAIEPEKEKRFIPVKSDDERMLTCFLEYFEGYVIVNDLLHEKKDGKWEFRVSAYRKLRLNRNGVVGMMVKTGFRVTEATAINGMLHVIAAKGF